MKKIIFSILLAFVLMSPFVSIVFAADGGNGPIEEYTLPSDVIIERYDVPLSVAINDETFSAKANFLSKNIIEVKSVTWHVWGQKDYNSSTALYYPVGFSEHLNGSTVLPTYHYTRTYLGLSWSPRGDSGRVWGSFTVRANGTDCLEEVWIVFRHKVFYGTTSD